jgi:rubredoxin
MTTEPEAPPIINAIVACGTCDTVFRAHEGRQTCPVCGGDAAFLIIDYTQDQASTPPSDVAPPAEVSAGPPAPRSLRPMSAPSSDSGPSAAGDSGTPAEAPAGEEEGVASPRRRRSRP